MNEDAFPTVIVEWVIYAIRWIEDFATQPENVPQIAAIAAAFAVARLAAPRLRARIRRFKEEHALAGGKGRFADALSNLTLFLVWLALQWAMVLVADWASWPYQIGNLVVSLLSAWVVIRFASYILRNRAVARAVAYVAWPIAALNVVGLLGPTVTFLDSLALQAGELRLSILGILKGAVFLALLLWTATALSGFLERRLEGVAELTPSVRVLSAKLVRILLITVAVVAALMSIGVDLTAFAVFGGAVGVGVGFGLQKVVGNLVSGVIILMDKSIKPGDVVTIGDTYGWINSLGARYVSVITRDGIEHLVPNEDLIVQRVENWSYSNRRVRLKTSIGVSYKSDIGLVRELCLEAAGEVARVLKEPKPVCLLTGFGDSSVDFSLRFWIDDPQNGVTNVRSEVLFLIWEKFHARGIEIPFPQRDLHIRSAGPARELAGLGLALSRPDMVKGEA